MSPAIKQVPRRLGSRGVAAGALAAIGALSYRAYRQGLFRSNDPSLQAWREFEASRPSGINRLVSAAVLAASPHNSQPWRFAVSDNQIELHADFGRKLGAMDPFEREMFIGLGCAVENIAIAAPGAGLATNIELMPGPTREVAARITVTASDTAPHRLEGAIVQRRTDRGPYDTTRPIDPASLDQLRSEVSREAFSMMLFSRDSREAERFGALTIDATRAIITDREMSHDSARWYRHSQPKIESCRDGLTMQTQGLAPWTETLVRLMPPAPEKVAHALWLKNTRDVHLATAAMVGMIVVPETAMFDDAVSLEVGRAWQRVHLAATQLGIACQPLNQIPERISRERQLGRDPKMRRLVAEQLPLDGALPTFCFRLGLPVRQPPHSPRRLAEQVITHRQ